MPNTGFRTITVNNEPFVFSTKRFKQYFDKFVYIKRLREKYTQQQCMEFIAEKTSVSAEGVKRWYRGYNGPSDLTIVQNIAKVFDIEYTELLERKNDMANSEIPAEQNMQDAQIVKFVFSKLVEAFLFREAFVSKPEKYQHTSSFEMYDDLISNIESVIEASSLDLKDSTIEKLRAIIFEAQYEYKNDSGEPARWTRLNPDFPDTKILQHNYVLNMEDITELHSKICRKYLANIELHKSAHAGNITYPGFSANATDEEICEQVRNDKTLQKKKSIKITIENEIEDLLHDQFPTNGNYSPYELDYSDDVKPLLCIDFYRIEYVKTLKLVFKEAFPELLNIE